MKKLKGMVLSLIAIMAFIPFVGVKALDVENVAVAADGSVTWSDVTGAVKYKIGNGTEWSELLDSASGSVTSYIASPADNTAYSLVIKAYDDALGTNEIATFSANLLYKGEKWYLGYHTITFNSNGGSSVSQIKVGSTETTVEPTAPKKEGYYFDGWFEDTSFNNAFGWGSTLSTNKTLNAKWLKRINSLDITITNPKVGDSVVLNACDDYPGCTRPSKYPEIKFDSDLFDVDFTAYIISFPSENNEYDTPFEGTFEKGKYYYAEVVLKATEGNLFTDNDHMTLKVNGKEADYEMSEYNVDGSIYYMFFVKLEATEETEEVTSNPNTSDNVTLYMSLLGLSILGLIAIKKTKKSLN